MQVMCWSARDTCCTRVCHHVWLCIHPMAFYISSKHTLSHGVRSVRLVHVCVSYVPVQRYTVCVIGGENKTMSCHFTRVTGDTAFSTINAQAVLRSLHQLLSPDTSCIQVTLTANMAFSISTNKYRMDHVIVRVLRVTLCCYFENIECRGGCRRTNLYRTGVLGVPGWRACAVYSHIWDHSGSPSIS